MSNEINRRRLYRLTQWGLLLFYFWIAWQVPYAHDDWDWGLSVGMEQLLTASINSRYAGNFFAVVLTRSEIVKTLVMGLGFYFTPLLIAKIACLDKEKIQPVFLLATLLTLGMPRAVWQQTYGWVAGYANFVASACLFLLYLYLIRNVFGPEPLRYGWRATFGVVPLCIALQLFIENLAVFNILFSLFILLYVAATRKKLYPIHLLSFLSFSFGIIFMFSSSIFTSLLSTGEALGGIRHLAYDREAGPAAILEKLLNRYVTEISPSLFEANWLLCLVLCVLCVIFALQSGGSSAARRGFAMVFSGFGAYFVMRRLYAGWRFTEDGQINGMIFAGISVLFMIAVCACVIKFAGDARLRTKLLAFFLSAPAVILPMLMVDTIGPRCFFNSNIFLTLFCATLFGHLLSKQPSLLRDSAVFLLPPILILMIYFGKIYWDIGECTRQRAEIVARAVEDGEKSITLPTDGHSGYWWFRNPTADWRLVYFKEFYGIPENVTINFK